jgi:hypothetical protein
MSVGNELIQRNISPEALNAIDRCTAHRWNMLPLSVADSGSEFAVAEELDAKEIEKRRFLCGQIAWGKPIVVLYPASTIQIAVLHYYGPYIQDEWEIGDPSCVFHVYAAEVFDSGLIRIPTRHSVYGEFCSWLPNGTITIPPHEPENAFWQWLLAERRGGSHRFGKREWTISSDELRSLKWEWRNGGWPLP